MFKIFIFRVVIFLAFMTMVSPSALAENRVWVNDMADEAKEDKDAEYIKNLNMSREDMRRPKACVCSHPINARTNEIITLRFQGLYKTPSGEDKLSRYLINCECGKIQCVVTNQGQQEAFCFDSGLKKK